MGFVLKSHTLENVEVITGSDHEALEPAMLRKRRKAKEKNIGFQVN